MAAFSNVRQGIAMLAEQLQQVIDALKGTPGRGKRISLTNLASASEYSLTIQNTGTGGKALKVNNAAGTTLMDITDSGVSITTLTGLTSLSLTTLTATTANLTTTRFGLGTVGAPGITPTGDTDTGFWSAGNDDLRISTAATERVRIASTGLLSAFAGISGSNASSTVYTATLQNTTSGARGLNVLNSAGTLSLLRVNSLEGAVFNGPWYNVKAYGATGDGTEHSLSEYFGSLAAAQAVYPHAGALTDSIDWAATQLAIDTAEAGGGGIIYFPPGRYEWDQAVTCQAPNIVLKGSGLGGHETDESAKAVIELSFAPVPAIIYGGVATAGVGMWNGIEDLLIFHLAAPTGTNPGGAYGDTVSATILLDRLGYRSGTYAGGNLVANGRFFMRRVGFATPYTPVDCIQIGTVAHCRGGGEVWIEQNVFAFSNDGIRVHGLGYLHVSNNTGGSNPVRNGGSFITFFGDNVQTLDHSPDGVLIYSNFTEDCSFFVRAIHSQGSVANVMVFDNLSDGTGSAGVYLHPGGGGCNWWTIANNTFNMKLASGSDPMGASNQWGVLVDEDAGTVGHLRILGNYINTPGTTGISILAPTAATSVTDTVIAYNVITNAGMSANGTYAAIDIGNGTAKFLIMHNIASNSTSAAAADGSYTLAHLVKIGTSCTKFTVAYNTSDQPVATSLISMGTANGPTTRYYENTGGETANEVAVIASPYAFRNRLCNGTFAIQQRATVGTADNSYILDRWRLLLAAAGAATAAQTTSVVPTDGAKTALALSVTATNNNKFGVVQFIEGVNCQDLRGKQVSLQLKARTSAAAAGNPTALRAMILEWTSTTDGGTTPEAFADPIDVWGAAGTNPTVIANWARLNTPTADFTLTTSYKLFKVEGITVGASANNLAVFIWNDDTTTTNTDVVYVTDVQLEEGPVCTPFERRPADVELGACQRYFERIGGSGGNFDSVGAGAFYSTTQARVMGNFVTTKRIQPTISTPDATKFAITNNAGTGTACSSIGTAFSGLTTVGLDVTIAAGGTAGYGTVMFANNDTAARLYANAEL